MRFMCFLTAHALLAYVRTDKQNYKCSFSSIMNKSQETTVFHRAPEIDFRYETKARKVMVDFKFDALYR